VRQLHQLTMGCFCCMCCARRLELLPHGSGDLRRRVLRQQPSLLAEPVRRPGVDTMWQRGLPKWPDMQQRGLLLS
jgi:hypothetical protein